MLDEFVGSFNNPTYTSDRLEYIQYLYCNVSLQGDKMYLKGLKVLENELIVLDLGVEFLSIDNLQTVVGILCSKNELSYVKLKKSQIQILYRPVIESFLEQNNIELPIGTQNNIEAQNQNQIWFIRCTKELHHHVINAKKLWLIIVFI